MRATNGVTASKFAFVVDAIGTRKDHRLFARRHQSHRNKKEYSPSRDVEYSF
jgi:hypothetical protein